jgi:protein O-mannosyl-transferase
MTGTGPDKRSKAKLLAAGSAALVTFLVYLPTLRNAFLNWDDDEYIYRNPFIRSFDFRLLKSAFGGFHSSNWHPLTWLSHAVDYALWGLNPLGHHLTNNIIHALNAGIVVALVMTLMSSVRKLSGKKKPPRPFFDDRTTLITGVATGVVFGLHPLHVESVAWASERKDLFCAFFFLLSLIVYAGYATEAADGVSRPGARFLNRKYLSALGLFSLSLLSKPMAVSLPVVLLLFDWYPFKRVRSLKSFGAACVEKIPFFALALLSSVVTVFAQKTGGALKSVTKIPLSARAIVAAKSLVAYLIKMAAPVNLVPFYPYPKSSALLHSPGYILSIVIVLAITAGCLAIARRRQLWPAIWGYYVITLLPVLGLVQVGAQAMADRYTYLPSLGPFFLFGLAAARVYEKAVALKRRKAVAAAGLVLIAATITASLAFATIRQIGVWKNSIVFWNYVIGKDPEIAFAHYNLGFAYAENGRLDMAVQEYRSALRLQPDYAKAHFNLGLIYLRQGDRGRARTEFAAGLKTKPNDVRARRILESLDQNQARN